MKRKQLLISIKLLIKRMVLVDINKIAFCGAFRFFKEEVEFRGVKIPVARKIARKYFVEIKRLDKKEVFGLCEVLLRSGYQEDVTIALDWASRLKAKYEKKDFKIFESWLKKYISNWATCDDLCCHIFGYFIFQFPEFLAKLNIWARSKSRWLKRASAVSLIYPVRKEKYIDKVFEIADMLLMDTDDLVQKGYGWLLKESTKHYENQVFAYVMKNKVKMPRTALRYAIEKMPESMKKKAMAK